MCGIVGFITTDNKIGEPDRSKFLKQALIIDTLRGDDSTGVFAVGHEPLYKDGTAWYCKNTLTGAEFTDSKEYWENMYDTSEYRCVVGHNRAATVGKVDSDSAHPFQVGAITMVHNGTLTSANVLPSPMCSLDGVTVDSHAIAHNLNIHPVEEVVENLYGAFALVWHDARDDSINVVRNTKRPLHFALGQQGKTLFFMSEGEMLHLLDRRIRLNLQQIYYPDEGQWLKWGKDTPLADPEVKKLDLYEDKWPVTTYSYDTKTKYGSYSWDDDDDDEYVYPKASAHQASDLIMLGGQRRIVPMLVQEAMLTHDVVTEDRLRFSPSIRVQNPQDTDRVGVTGYVDGMKAILYSLQRGTATIDAMRRDWVVRVIGVKVTDDGEPWLICRLVNTFVGVGSLTRKPPVPLKEESANATKRRDGNVPGKDGELISQAEFAVQVADGCVMCRHHISVMDAYDVVWVSDNPICPNCDERYYEDLTEEELSRAPNIH